MITESNLTDVKLTKAMACSNTCWTDHRQIRSIMSLPLEPEYRKTKGNVRHKYGLDRLNDPNVLSELHGRMKELIKTAKNTQDSTTFWNNIKEAITNSYNESLGTSKRHHEDWFDKNDVEITRITDEKRTAFKAWQDDYGSRTKRAEYHKLRSTVQRQLREVKNR